MAKTSVIAIFFMIYTNIDCFFQNEIKISYFNYSYGDILVLFHLIEEISL
jgi:hypothetical protein